MRTIVWNGALLDPSGYGNCARHYVKALALNNKTVYTEPVRYYHDQSPENYLDVDMLNLINMLSSEEFVLGKDFIHVEHKTPTELSSIQSYKSVGYTVWETDSVPKPFLEFLNKKDCIWTASEYSKIAIINSGYSGNVFVIPHVIDHPSFDNTFKEKADPLTFLFNGEMTYRKGIDILVKAFSKAFSKEDKAQLLIKTYLLDNGSHGSDHIKNTIDNWKSGSTANIKVFDRVIPDSQIPDLYKLANIFVSATRGEGFGIPIAEAMAANKLVIVPDKGGHTDFCHYANCFMVDSEQVPIPDSMIERGREVYRGQKWVETDEDDLISVLRYVYDEWINEQSKFKYKALKGKQAIQRHCDGKIIVDRIGDLI